LKSEAEVYLEAVAEMTTSAKTATNALRTALARIAREEERVRNYGAAGRGVPPPSNKQKHFRFG
jgi:hypothetical protein